jgi:carbamoyltransferase
MEEEGREHQGFFDYSINYGSLRRMYILGVNLASHDSSACLLKDGMLLGFIEEERLNRQKHTSALPLKAVDLLLKTEGITMSDIEHLAVFTVAQGSLWRSVVDGFNLDLSKIHHLLWSKIKYRRKFSKDLKSFVGHYHFTGAVDIVDHHMAHLAAAFLVSPFKKAAVVSLDGMGDGYSGKFAIGEGNTLRVIGGVRHPHSIGLLYEKVTQYLGFGETGDEGKVMGLSSYGDPSVYLEQFRNILILDPDGGLRLNPDYLAFKNTGVIGGSFKLSPLFVQQFGPARTTAEPIERRHQDIAAALQKMTEQAIHHVLTAVHAQTECDALAFGGGVVLNSVANGTLSYTTPFKKIFIQPIGYDGGSAIGAAYYVWNILLSKPRTYTWNTAYLGPAFSSSQIQQTLDALRLRYEVLPDPGATAAKLIADGNIIGWFQGRMEAGARALGNRSILADPRIAEMKDIINARVKFRESFRPFAPVVLEEHTGRYFEIDMPVQFMERVFMVKKDKQSEIPAVTHVDGTGRLQTINKRQNPEFYDLLSKFHGLTGVPVVLNTSFNIKGEPIVCTPVDAIRCFYSTGMDQLILDRFLLSKK